MPGPEDLRPSSEPELKIGRRLIAPPIDMSPALQVIRKLTSPTVFGLFLETFDGFDDKYKEAGNEQN